MRDEISEHVLAVIDQLQKSYKHGGIADSEFEQLRRDYAPQIEPWLKTPPTEPGEYAFCIKGSRQVRRVKVLRSAWGNDRRLYTNEDGGALVTDDELYAGGWWMRLPDLPPLPKPPENP